MASISRTGAKLGSDREGKAISKYEDVDLLKETFAGTDVIDVRRRETYDAVVDVFKTYHRKLAKNAAAAKAEARRAFGESVDDAGVPSFEKSVQIMLGGDEVFVAANPRFASYVHQIIRDLDGITRSPPYDDYKLELRAAVAFSKAVTDAQNQRTRNQESHEEAMKLADVATGPLKQLERAPIGGSSGSSTCSSATTRRRRRRRPTGRSWRSWP